MLLLTQTAFIPYITDMTIIGQAAKSGSAFIPESYDPTDSEVKFVGAMGIIGVLSYGFSFVGAVAFMQFTLYAYQAGKPEDRPASYYKGMYWCEPLLLHALLLVSHTMIGLSL